MLHKLLLKIQIRWIFKMKSIMSYLGLGSAITFISMIFFAYYHLYSMGFIVGLILSNLATLLIDKSLHFYNLKKLSWNMKNCIYTTIGSSIIIGSIQFVIQL